MTVDFFVFARYNKSIIKCREMRSNGGETVKLAENIVNFRKERGLTQARLAEALNMTPAAVSKWETGAAVPDLDTLIALADYFRVPMDDLLGRTLEEKPRVVLFAPEKEVEKVVLRVLKDYNYQVLGVGRSLEELEALLARLKEKREHVDQLIVQTLEYPVGDKALTKLGALNAQYVGTGMLCSLYDSSLKKLEATLRITLEPD